MLDIPFKFPQYPTSPISEITEFVGVVVGFIFYGITIPICATTIYYLITTSKLEPHLASHRFRQHNIAWIICILILFTGGTTNVVGNVLSHMDTPQPITFPDCMSYLNGVLVDAILGNWWLNGKMQIYRVYRFYKSWYIIVIPILMLLCTTILGTCFVLQITTGSTWFTTHTLELTIPYFSLSLSLNISLTLLISIRLFIIARSTRRLLGKKHSRLYTDIARMIIESSTPYAVVSGVLLALFMRGHPGARIVLPIYVQVQVATPTLIILRVCLSRARKAQPPPGAELGDITFDHDLNLSEKSSTSAPSNSAPQFHPEGGKRRRTDSESEGRNGVADQAYQPA
ncbi:hypothetical protein BJ165DRAFT_1574820 [Panaeolus papilionaceus]|nr:hypothetical protein BJ165DRAFT_1574820 [Panaeolus papilionaceus]